MEKLRIQQEQTLGIPDTQIDAMMERGTQAIMDRLDGLLGSRSEPKDRNRTREDPAGSRGGTSMTNNVGEGHMDPLKVRGSSAGYATGDNRTWGPNIGGSSTGNRQNSNERPTQGTHATGRDDSRNSSHASPGMSHASQGRNNPSESDGREVPSTEPLSGGNDTQGWQSREATSTASAF